MKNYDYLVAIDPDAKASGLALLKTATKEISLYSLLFPNLLNYLKDSQRVLPNLVVYVEASWLRSSKNGNTHNWHLKKNDNAFVASAKGEGIARNQETGRKIVEMCKYYGIEVVEALPLKKSWKGRDRKITHEELAYFIPGLPKTSNQETRDAALLAWYYAGFPIRVKPMTIK